MSSQTLRIIIRHYAQHHRSKKREQLEWFSAQPSLEALISKAAFAEDMCGKRLSHQRRIRRCAMESASIALLKNAVLIANATTFGELLTIVAQSVEGVLGLGELYIYDTALRIGAKYNLEPDQVYLHAGTRKGAKALGLDSSAKAIPLEALPSPLRELSGSDVEDILCIYKGSIGKACDNSVKT